MSPRHVNIASHLAKAALARPDVDAVIAARKDGGWNRLTFAQLEARSTALAAALTRQGVGKGVKTLVMVKAGVDLITVTFALFKAGAIPVLIDPGMGIKPFLKCVEKTQPEAFIGIPLAQAVRTFFPKYFRSVKTFVTVGPRLFWGGLSFASMLKEDPAGFTMADTLEDDTAAVLFTSGSTGPAKGVVYTQGIFDAQVHQLRDVYGFKPGEVDVAAFPLFSLFDCALEMTSVIPDLDPSRPGRCNPANVVAALQQHNATTAFGSPAIWRRVAPYCEAQGIKIPALKRILIAGASVPPKLIAQLHLMLPPDGDVQTPYGATESLPVANITGRDILLSAKEATAKGAGTCVGKPVPGITARIIKIVDGPIAVWSEDLVLPQGEVGELCVQGEVVTRIYDGEPQATAGAKIQQDGKVWHRMGDLARMDAQGRLWFCGRKSERVQAESGNMFTDCVEGTYLMHPKVGRVALVGVGEIGKERPVLVVEGPQDATLANELRAMGTIEHILFHDRFPVDVRHNAKIHRHTLKKWAQERVA